MASDILDRVAMVITDTGAGALVAVTANVLISDRFNTPQEAGAVDGKSYWWMIEEGVNYEIFEGVWTLEGTKVARGVIWQSKINGVHGATKITLGGNATLRSITPAEALNYIRFDAAQALTAAQQKQARANAGTDDRNVLINPDFRVNQRGYGSGVAQGAGAYYHDRWKAGAGGATYTFAQSAGPTTITITAGSIMQVVEDKNVEGGTYVLSWAGTAKGRAGVNSATPAGGYANSPLVINGQNAGTAMSVEFNAGTLGKVKLELGAVPTPFVMRDITTEENLCFRYYWRNTTGSDDFAGTIRSGADANATVFYPVLMRAIPSLSIGWAVSGSSGTTVRNSRRYCWLYSPTSTDYVNAFIASAEL